MERELRRCAGYVIGRNCRLVGGGIIIVILAASDDPGLALLTGGLLNLALCVALILFGLSAEWRDVRRTEVWYLLHQRLALARSDAARRLAAILRETYVRFAHLAGLLAAFFVVMSLLWGSLGLDAPLPGEQRDAAVPVEHS